MKPASYLIGGYFVVGTDDFQDSLLDVCLSCELRRLESVLSDVYLKNKDDITK